MAIIRRVTRIANPRKRRTRVKRRATIKARHTRSNPVLLEFGLLNPRQKRRKSVAKHRRKRRSSNPRRHAVARVHHRRRHSNHRRRRNPMVNRHHHRRRRNPMGINKQLIEMAGGVLIGVAASKYLPTLIPVSMLNVIPQSSFSVPLVTAVGTVAAGWLAHKFLPMGVAAGVVAGGAALTLSRLLDVVAPASIAGQLHLAGVGDIVNTQGFAVPDRSMRAQVVQMAPVGASGVGIYGRGNYRRAGF
jgi:hypothetical protein